jgi:hypothetical protein
LVWLVEFPRGIGKKRRIAQFSLYLIVGLLAKLVYAGSKKLEQKGLTKGFLETAVRFACVFIAVLNSLCVFVLCI